MMNTNQPRSFPKLLGLVLFIILIPFILVYLGVYFVYGLFLTLMVWMTWIPRGKNTLLVSSESPVWCGYMDTEVIAPLKTQAVILNWSARSTWKRRLDLAHMAFRFFGGSREFNPLAVVFKPFRIPKVFRFWQPFKDYKHGNPDALEETKGALLNYALPKEMR